MSSQNGQKKNTRMLWYSVPTGDLSGNRVCPHRDSNPSFGLERATSWATRQWGLKQADCNMRILACQTNGLMIDNQQFLDAFLQ